MSTNATYPFTFEVMSPSGYNDGPITVMAASREHAAELAAKRVEIERRIEVIDVMDNTIVIPDEPTHDCPKDAFLADPITVAYGVGAEMVGDIPCAVCDAEASR